MGLDTSIRDTLPLPGGEAARAPGAASGLAPKAESDIDLRRVLATLWRVKWLLMLLAGIGAAISWVHLERVQPLYEAEARVLWEYTETNVVDINPVTSGYAGDVYALNSQVELIKSGRLLRRVVKRMKMAEDPVFNAALLPPEGWTRWISPRTWVDEAQLAISGGEDAPVEFVETPAELEERLVQTVRGMLSMSWVDTSYVLRITAMTADPRRSAELANAVAEVYILDQLEQKFEATRQATSWLSERVGDLRAELEAAEQSVEDFSSASSLVSEEALAQTARQLKDLRLRAISLGEQADDVEKRLTAARAARRDGDRAKAADLLGDPALAGLAGTTGADPAAIDRGLDRGEQRLADSLARLTGQRDAIRGSVIETEAKIDEQSASLVQLRQLQREAAASKLIYESFLARLKETTVQEGIQRPDARMLTDAVPPMLASSPRRGATLAIGAAGGVLLGLFLVILVERLNSSFRTSDELERKTGMAVLGSMPQAPVGRRRAILTYLLQRPTSSMAEAVRNLRTSILLANVDKPPQVIMLTSSLPAEGKTTVCISLAQISRALGKRVLLVECDLRRRTFRHYFDIDEKAPGLLSVLAGSRGVEEVVHVDPASGLHVLPGEHSSVNAADIFASQRFSDFLDEMRQHYDFIFVDTPPVLAVPDARVIARKSDAVIFVVRWNKTPRETAMEGIRYFQQINVRIAGLVLSQVNMKKMARYGYTAYGYYKEAARYYHN